MRTYLDCVPCFVRQALDSARHLTDSPEMHEQLLREVLTLASTMSFDSPPPVMGRLIHRRLRELTGQADPYKAAKQKAKEFALRLYPDLKDIVISSRDPLAAAVKFAIAGNVIDLGVLVPYDHGPGGQRDRADVGTSSRSSVPGGMGSLLHERHCVPADSGKAPIPNGYPRGTSGGGAPTIMRIAIASGKGGTGKTTVATNLAYVASLDGRTVAYVDCDVEEPNGHLFLKPEWLASKPVTRPAPLVDESKCTQCGRCGEICEYSAIVPLGTTVLVYPELCHGCGGCMLVCPAGAITETPREIGVLEMGWSGDVQFNRGVLHIGEAMSPPLIRQVKSAPPDTDLTLIDAPPG
ncbi:MAG: DUF89 family protein, partial [Planctomycetes bacterium]|nr:DUF89 family protein [Planctomycetota bacterium]